MKLEIIIDQSILNRSANCTENAGQNCAIALAIYDIFGAKSQVDGDCIIICKNDIEPNSIILRDSIMATIELPEQAQIFILNFDWKLPHQRVQMTPFAFEIEIPDNVVEMINIDEIYKVLETSTCLKLVKA